MPGEVLRLRLVWWVFVVRRSRCMGVAGLGSGVGCESRCTPLCGRRGCHTSILGINYAAIRRQLCRRPQGPMTGYLCFEPVNECRLFAGKVARHQHARKAAGCSSERASEERLATPLCGKERKKSQATGNDAVEELRRMASASAPQVQRRSLHVSDTAGWGLVAYRGHVRGTHAVTLVAGA